MYSSWAIFFDSKFSIHIYPAPIVSEIFHKNCFRPLTLKAIFAPSTNKKIRVKYFYMDYKSASYIEIDSTYYDIPLHIASEIETV